MLPFPTKCFNAIRAPVPVLEVATAAVLCHVLSGGHGGRADALLGLYLFLRYLEDLFCIKVRPNRQYAPSPAQQRAASTAK